MDRAVEGPQPISKTRTCSFAQGGTGWALLVPYRTTSIRTLVLMSLPKQWTSWRWPQGPTSCSGPCAHCPAPWSSTGTCLRTQVRYLSPVLFTDKSRFHPEHLWWTWKNLEKTRRTSQIWWWVSGPIARALQGCSSNSEQQLRDGLHKGLRGNIKTHHRSSN